MAVVSQPLLLRDVELRGRRTDVLVRDGRVASIGSITRAPRGTAVVDAGGGALLPGLHDHHVHLLAMAATAVSVDCSPSRAAHAGGLEQLLREADRRLPPGQWLRGTGFDETVAGPWDRRRLDTVVPGRPARLQHRSGVSWLLNSAGLAALADGGLPEAAERDAAGQATGWLHHADDAVRRADPAGPPDLAAVSRDLAGWGVTGITDAGVHNGPPELAVLTAAVARGELRQRVLLLGGPDLPAHDDGWVRTGARKIVLEQHRLPALAQLRDDIRAAHGQGRPVAVHCVSVEALVLLLAAHAEAGALSGDRVEHASLVPPELMAPLRASGLRVVTQPGFVYAHGDRYGRTVAEDHDWLYRCGTLLRAGVPVGGSTDAPFGPADPWVAMGAAVTRSSAGGDVLGPAERVDPDEALSLFASDPGDPGGPARAIVEGGPADLCLLRAPWRDVRARLRQGRVDGRELVALTVIGGAHVAGH